MAEQKHEERNEHPVAEPQQRQARPCPRDCTKCGYQQHAFCAARMSFQMFEVMNGVIQRLDIQSQRLAELEQRLSAIQSSEGEFSSPLPFDDELPAPEGDGQ